MATVAVLLSGCTSTDVEAKLRFGWPTGVTKQAERMRVLWTWSSVAALVVGVIVWGLIFWACIRYRKRDDRLPRQTKENLIIEALYTIVPFFIIGGLFYYTVVTENYVEKRTKNPDVTVTVTAFKWNWKFGYNNVPYASTVTGAASEEAVSTIGTSTEIPILVIPRGKTVRVVEHSQDVIHSFWVPEFLFKRDVIPQPKDNQFEFTATENGHYVGRCAELCGTYHSQMNFEVRVVDPDKYTAYLATLAKLGPNNAARQAQALTSIGEAPTATTTHPFNTDRTKRSATEK
jgi:cytochrome c oxidase subunit 2